MGNKQTNKQQNNKHLAHLENKDHNNKKHSII